MPEIINNNYRDKVLNDPVRKWAESKSDDELRAMLGQLEQIQAKEAHVSAGGGDRLGRAAGYLGDIFLQRGGIKPPERDTGRDTGNETKPSVEKPKSIKEQAFEAISKNETLPGLSVEETKKVAGVYIPGAKLSAAAEKRGVEESKLSEELGGLLNSFTRAKEEAVKAIPKFGARGIQGRLAGISAGAVGSMGYLPATNVYNKQRKAFATVVAKAAGEVRPTDEDINRFVQTLPDTGKSDEENALLIADIQDKVSKGGISNLWVSQKNSNIPTQVGQGDEYGLYLQSIGAQ